MTSTLRCGFVGRFWPYRTGAMQDPASELPRIPLPRLSEKSRRHPKRGRHKAPNRPVWPVLTPIDGPYSRLERHSHPFSDSLGRGILRSSQGRLNHTIYRCVEIGVCVVWKGSPTKGGGRQIDEETDPTGSARPSALADCGCPRDGRPTSHPRSILVGRERGAWSG